MKLRVRIDMQVTHHNDPAFVGAALARAIASQHLCEIVGPNGVITSVGLREVPVQYSIIVPLGEPLQIPEWMVKVSRAAIQAAALSGVNIDSSGLEQLQEGTTEHGQ